MTRPTKGTIQWIAPHLSESEVKAIYELVLEKVIGGDTRVGPNHNAKCDCQIIENELRAEQRDSARQLFGMDNK